MNEFKSSNPDANFSHGAEWVRADFHLHTKADQQFSYTDDPNYYNSNYIEALQKAGIRLGVITNHNKFDHDEFKALRSTAKKQGISIQPGVELSIDEGFGGVHVLIVFSDAWLERGNDYISPFIGSLFPGKTPDQYQYENGKSDKNLLQLVETLEGLSKDFFLIFAHVEDPKGLWAEVGCGRLKDWTEDRHAAIRRRTLGFQKVRSYNKLDKASEPCRAKVQQVLGEWYPAEVEGSDPKAINEIGKGKPCYLKLGELSFEAMKFALFDHNHRVRPSLPEARSSAIVRQIRFAGGVLEGSVIPFSSSLSCLIGPRGNGKSAVIECLRHALGFREVSDEKYKAGLVERMLSPAGKVIVEAVDEHGRAIRIERERSGQPSVFLDGAYRDISPGSVLKDILYFGQKDLSTRSESFDESFLDKLLADRLDIKPQEEGRLLESIRQAVRQLKETLEASEKIAVAQKEKNELEVQLQIYTDKGVDKKLEEMTLFDTDRQAILGWQEELKQLGTGIKEVTDWTVVDWAFPSLHSKRTEFLRDDLAKAKAKSDEAKQSAEACLTGLRDAFALVTEATKKLTPVQDEMKTEVAALQKSLNEPQLDLEVFRKKKARLEQLKKLLNSVDQRAKTEQAARDLLGAAVNNLHEFWRERFQERESEVRRLERELPEEIRIRTAFKGKRQAFEEFLRASMRGSGLQGSSYETLRDAFIDGRELYQARAELEKHLSEIAATKVKTALLDHLADFLTFRTPDVTEILYQGKPLGDYSLGQRATVILHILMHLRRHPVILIDQPEDDLDNETLYSHFIHQLLDRKELTQFIFATHNPNIPVLGDAEQTIVCRKEGEHFSFEHGSIDNKRIQDRIVTVMEGGEDAFRRRKEIYQLWKSSN